MQEKGLFYPLLASYSTQQKWLSLDEHLYPECMLQPLKSRSYLLKPDSPLNSDQICNGGTYSLHPGTALALCASLRKLPSIAKYGQMLLARGVVAEPLLINGSNLLGLPSGG